MIPNVIPTSPSTVAQIEIAKMRSTAFMIFQRGLECSKSNRPIKLKLKVENGGPSSIAENCQRCVDRLFRYRDYICMIQTSSGEYLGGDSSWCGRIFIFYFLEVFLIFASPSNFA